MAWAKFPMLAMALSRLANEGKVMRFKVGDTIWHGCRYWKSDSLEAGEVLGWNTEYRRYLVTRITAKRIVVFWERGSESIHEVQLNRETMERDGKQYHSRFHEYFYAEKPRPESKDWNFGRETNLTL